MKRALAALVCGAVIAALVPATASAARPTRYEEHRVVFDCSTGVDGGFAQFFVDDSSQFGTFSELAVWLDPAVPFEEPATVDGVTEAVDVVEGSSDVTVAASFELFDPNGDPAGEGQATATLAFVGDPLPPDIFPSTNHKDRTEGTRQPIEGEAEIHVPGLDATLSDCSGELTNIRVFTTSPTSFVNHRTGVTVSCFWQDGDAAAGYNATRDSIGIFVDVFESTPDHERFGSAQTGSFTSTALHTTTPMTDMNGEHSTATASATFAAVGAPVTSKLRGQNRQEKLVQQALATNGSLEITGGGTYPMDDEHCQANSFADNVVVTGSKGPKAGGTPPSNDTPDGAIAIAPGSRVKTTTRAASLEPEVPNETCPEGSFDGMGRTLWYTVAGTGDPVTIDTAGSGFDTVLAVYVRDGDAFTEVACDDDVVGDPVGIDFQAALTLDTDASQTYYVQVGGFRFPESDTAEYGQLQLTVR